MNKDNVIAPQSAQEGSGPGPFLAKVVSHLDPTYMGMLEVEILRPVGNDPGAEGQLHQVKMISPFWGQTSTDYVGKDPDDYNNTQKSYGMWFVPPDPGTTVIVFFIDGDPKRGYWMGGVPDESVNFMVPGIAATEFVVEGGGRIPVAEYNKEVNSSVTDSTKVNKPRHPLADVLEQKDQGKGGLLKDDIRGITTSSARREVPSAVFGISTPGPIDKRSGAKKGAVGKSEHKIPNAFVSRLGGTTFVMDDGDDKFLRKTHAKDGPPTYVAVEQGETGGTETIPHNELVRIRTRTGHQILLHNSEDLIYIGNARGTTWIELTSNGKIDIYAKDSISVHTEADLNFTADRDINFTAKNNINMYAGVNINQQSGKDWNLKVGAAGKITTQALDIKGTAVKLTASSGLDINSGGASKWSSSGQASIGGSAIIIKGGSVDINGAAAPAAASAATAGNALKATRIPQAEPWNGHENLDPAAFKPEKTKAAETIPAATAPAAFNKYTTTTDTFKQIKPPETTS